MGRVIITGAMIKYPWGGLIQYFLAWIIGVKKAGYDVYYVEEVEWEYACYNVLKKEMTSDPSYGIGVITNEFKKYGLENNWCFVDDKGAHYGMNKRDFMDLFEKDSLIIDLEYDSFPQLSSRVGKRVYIDGEPGWNQMGIENMVENGGKIPTYDVFVSMGLNVGTNKFKAPDLNLNWIHTFCPVLTEVVHPSTPKKEAPFTTVMNWKANPDVKYKGKTYGMKDMEFKKFMDLPLLANTSFEIAVSRGAPVELLSQKGWNVIHADEISSNVDTYHHYISQSKAEFSVAKNVHVETWGGMFLERSGYYMASGRAVVLQDTGWSAFLPTNRGLFSFNTIEEAKNAIEEINTDFIRQGQWAKEIVHEFLDAPKVLRKLLDAI